MSRTIEEHYAGYASACERFKGLAEKELGPDHPLVQAMNEARVTAVRLGRLARDQRVGREQIRESK